MTEEELEDKAKEYADNQIGCGDGYYEWTDVLQAYLAGAEPREKRIAELEKENAELKETVIKMNNVITETFSKLTKAKELLKRLLITSCNSDVLNLLPNCSEVLRVRVEAEQFLKNDSCPDVMCEDCTKEDCGTRQLGLVGKVK